MNEELRHLREDDLAFFGRIGAAISHEMRNVLSVIGENAGLMEDLLGLAERGGALDCEKLKQLSENITKQVRNGTQTMERFSRFAHAADEKTVVFDLTAVIGNTTALVQRHVTQMGCRLEAELPAEEIPVRANSFAVQHLVFLAIELILDSVGNGGLVRITLVRQRPMAMIIVSGRAIDRADELSGQISELFAAMSELKGSVETSSADGMDSVILSIPVE